MHRSRSLTTTTRTAAVAADPQAVWAVVASGARGPQWYVDAAPFVFRGALDRLVGGRGRRWPPPGAALLERGDRAGFWDVTGAEDLDGGAHRLTLQASVRAPGTVRLTTTVDPVDAGSRVTQTISFAPDGVLGAAYLLSDLPARAVVAELTMLHLLTMLRKDPAIRAIRTTRRDNRSWRSSVDRV